MINDTTETMSHADPRDTETNFDFLSAYRALAGTILIVIGVVLALYVALEVFRLIEAKEPAGLIQQLVPPAVEKLEDAEDVANKNVPIDLSADIKKILVYGMIFLLLTIPAAIASKLVSSGGQLMQNEAAKALKQIAAKLSER